jgi:flagellar basal-body rod modification protein FlgD
MALEPISSATDTAAQTSRATATDAFGMGFEDLLRIVLTQLTYQDPLKPMENFEFVSQLAQFSQIQQGQTANESLQGLISAATTNQATSLLGHRIEIPTSGATISGVVKAISFQSGEPRLTIKTNDNQTISNLALSSVNRVTEGD